MSNKSISRRNMLKATASTIAAAGVLMDGTRLFAATGNAVTTVEVPGYEGRGLPVAAGSTIRVTDVEGTQVGDMFALVQSDPHEYLCTARTRLYTRSLFPAVGQSFVTNLYRPILTFITDTSPGKHDTLYESCDSGLYELLGGQKSHPNCHDNFLRVARELELDIDDVPGPVNFFQYTPVGPDGELTGKPAPTKPGDYVELYAEVDLYFILTACSVDVGSDINGGESTPLRIDVIPPTIA